MLGPVTDSITAVFDLGDRGRFEYENIHLFSKWNANEIHFKVHLKLGSITRKKNKKKILALAVFFGTGFYNKKIERKIQVLVVLLLSN